MNFWKNDLVSTNHRMEGKKFQFGDVRRLNFLGAQLRCKLLLSGGARSSAI